MHARSKTVGSVVGAFSLVLLASACSSSGSSPGTTSSAGSSSAASSSGVQEAKQFLSHYLTTPTSLELQPLSAKPPTGKKLALLTNAQPIGVRVGTAAKAAAAALGWSLTSIDVGDTPATAVSAFDAALAMHPDAILDNGEPAALFATQLKQAKAAGIPYFSASTIDPPSTPGLTGQIGGAAYSDLWGKILAAEFVSSSNAHGSAVFVSIPEYSVVVEAANAFVKAVKQWCPSCGATVLSQQVTDIGTKTPANIVAYLTRNPSTRWLALGFGDIGIGLPAALQSASIKANIMTNAPNASDIAAIKAGTEVAATAYSTDVEGWRLVDLAARKFTNTPLAPALAQSYQTQLLTKANAGQAKILQGYFVAPVNYQAQFKSLWKVG